MKRCPLLSLIVLFIVSACALGQTESEIHHYNIGDLDFYSIQDAPFEIPNEALITDDKETLKNSPQTENQRAVSVCSSSKRERK